MPSYQTILNSFTLCSHWYDALDLCFRQFSALTLCVHWLDAFTHCFHCFSEFSEHTRCFLWYALLSRTQTHIYNCVKGIKTMKKKNNTNYMKHTLKQAKPKTRTFQVRRSLTSCAILFPAPIHFVNSFVTIFSLIFNQINCKLPYSSSSSSSFSTLLKRRN